MAFRPGTRRLPAILAVLLGTAWGCKQEVRGTSRGPAGGGASVAASPAPRAAGTAAPMATPMPQGTPASRPSSGSTGTRVSSSKPSTPALGKNKECGEASYYGQELAGNATASGERFNPSALTAAHKTLPLGTTVTVVLRSNASKKVQVRINDRGPFAHGRIVDLSTAAFTKIASASAGVVDVCVHWN